MGLASAVALRVFLFLTFYLQATKGMTPLETGLAFLPMNLSVIAAATIMTMRVLPRTGAAARAGRDVARARSGSCC